MVFYLVIHKTYNIYFYPMSEKPKVPTQDEIKAVKAVKQLNGVIVK